MTSDDHQKQLESIEASKRFHYQMLSLIKVLEMSLDRFNSSVAGISQRAMSREARHFMNGSIIVHLYSMWDNYFECNVIDNYFREDEKELFYAFKHLRIVAAHNIDGSRRGNYSDRMKHAEKLDNIMKREPFEGLILSEFSVDMGGCFIALECHQFLTRMASVLAGRIYVGGPLGKIRCVGPDGHGTTGVL